MTRWRRATERARAIGLFRYQLIREPADPGLSSRARGRLVREIAAREHTDPAGRRVRVSRDTLDRWIRAWRRGGFDALVPGPRQSGPRLPVEVIEMAVALKRENPDRTAAQVRRILRAQMGWAPGERTLQRCFADDPLIADAGALAAGARSGPVFGRFEAGGPTSCGPVTRCTARTSAAARPTCSRSSTTTPGRSWGTGSGSPRTPCAWPPRCGRRCTSRRQPVRGGEGLVGRGEVTLAFTLAQHLQRLAGSLVAPAHLRGV